MLNGAGSNAMPTPCVLLRELSSVPSLTTVHSSFLQTVLGTLTPTYAVEAVPTARGATCLCAQPRASQARTTNVKLRYNVKVTRSTGVFNSSSTAPCRLQIRMLDWAAASAQLGRIVLLCVTVHVRVYWMQINLQIHMKLQWNDVHQLDVSFNISQVLLRSSAVCALCSSFYNRCSPC